MLNTYRGDTEDKRYRGRQGVTYMARFWEWKADWESDPKLREKKC